jgi:hypothetical protein
MANFLCPLVGEHTKSVFSPHRPFISGPKSYFGNAEKRDFVSVGASPNLAKNIESDTKSL